MACIKRASGSNGLLSSYICICVLTSITIISGLILASTTVSADDSVVDDVAVTVPVSCTMSGTGMNSHTREVVSGTYESEIGTTRLKAFCNDPNGFAIYAIGFTNDTYGETYLDSSIGSASDIATGTAESGATSNWAMKLTAAEGESVSYPMTLDNGFGAYRTVPATYTKVAHRSSGTDVGTSAEGSTLTSTYAAYMSNTQPAGTYTGKVKYTLVHPQDEEPLQPQPATAGCINYFANGSSVTGQMGCQSASNNASVTLWASNFKRPGYGFAGWNTAFDYSGTYYGPNQTITTPADVSTNGLSLYAVWVKSAGTLQNWSGCSSLAQGSVTALTDSRDNDTYAIAKLADGKCWMIENLRLDDSAELSSANTHNPSLPLTNVYDTSSTSNHLSPTSSVAYDATTASEGWCTANSTACDDQSRLRTDNTVLFTNNTASSYSASSNVYSYGNYYNWYSATAGHGKYGSSYGNGYHAPGDICPAGWHLPTGKATTGEFALLDIALGGTGASSSSSTTPTGADMSKAWRTYPNNFVYSGYVNGSSVDRRNSYGAYWSASGNDSNGAYYLYFYSTRVYPGTNYNNKYAGRLVRCLSGS